MALDKANAQKVNIRSTKEKENSVVLNFKTYLVHCKFFDEGDEFEQEVDQWQEKGEAREVTRRRQASIFSCSPRHDCP